MLQPSWPSMFLGGSQENVRALPGDQPDPASHRFIRRTGWTQWILLYSVLHGAKIGQEKTGDRGQGEGNGGEASHAGESLLVLPHPAPERRRGASQWSRLLTLQLRKAIPRSDLPHPGEWERSGRRNQSLPLNHTTV